ncbi:PREDICTED: uncharacterized protein LOC109359930 [Lupinus angustifolius]|uniref:uncharacterized protein LOC109359930 n=1 Tax=Lupinus angustifolius TaxID=3871 RepID=UPI00092E8FEB|nr:PREDICTED: uncharacterized protein LOC109359930 [Lupinus angustifolius]
MTTSNGFAMNLPILDGKNYDHWSIQMKAIFGFQECLEVVQDHSNFEKISAASSSKEAWDILEKCYAGGRKVKKVRLQMMRRQYELLQMEEQERVSEYFTRIRGLINQMRSCGEQISEQGIVEKILRTLSTKFDHVVVAIEESKDLEHFKIDELQGSLEAHEQRFLERMNDRDGRRWQSDKRQEGERSNQYSQGLTKTDSSELERKYIKKPNNGKKKKDKSNIQHFNCRNWGHFASECKLKRRCKDAEARLAKDEDSDEEVLLMAEKEITGLEGSDLDEALLMITAKNDQQLPTDSWYLDTGCSNHMTWYKEWFLTLDDSVKTKVKFADNSFITA